MRDLKRLAEEVAILLRAEGIDSQDKERALNSVSECVLPGACADAYLKYIYRGTGIETVDVPEELVK